MPLTLNQETFYSALELSEILHTSPEEIHDFVATHQFSEVELQDMPLVKKSQLETFFQTYFDTKGISEDRKYDLPDHLTHNTCPWAIALVKMYQKKVNFPAAISPAQGEFLRSLVCNLNPQTVVEIGCFTGISTIWIASALEQLGGNARVHSIDLFNEILPWLPTRHGCLLDPYQFAQDSVTAAQLAHRVKFYKMNSVEAGQQLPTLVQQPIDFLFIDGDHTKQGCLSDWLLFSPHVAVGGYIVFHDIYPEHCGWEGPRYVIDEHIKGNAQFELTEIQTSPHNFGMAVVRKVSATPPLPMLTEPQQPALAPKSLLKKLVFRM